MLKDPNQVQGMVSAPLTGLCFSTGGGCAGDQCSLSEVPSKAQRHDDFSFQHAER